MRYLSGPAALAMLALAMLATMPAAAQNDGVAKKGEPSWPPAGVSFNGDSGAPADLSGLGLGSMTGVPGVAFAPNRGPADGRPATYYAPWPLPSTAEFQKIHDDRAAAAKTGTALADVTAQCLPFGLPRMLLAKVYPDEIVQTSGNVTIWVPGEDFQRQAASVSASRA